MPVMRVLAVSGSSGGHIFPAVSFISALKKQCPQAQIILVLPKKALEFKIVADRFKIKYISSVITKRVLPGEPPRPCSLRCARARFFVSPVTRFVCVIINFFESIFILIEFRPDVVAGFGSLSSLPMVLCAWGFRIKTLIHEQNVVPGKANRLLAKFVNRIAISFDRTKDYLKVNPWKIILTGNPLRQELKIIDKKEALEFCGLGQGKVTLLVSGGSQGSRKINECFFEAVSKIGNKQNLQVIHISGNADFSELSAKYKNLDIKAKIFAFCDRMEYIYSAADLVISRSGALTITELINFRKPAILIPYPFAGAHQIENAKVLSEAGAAWLIEEKELSPDILKDNIEGLVSSDKLDLMRQAFSGFSLNRADNLLAQAVLTLARRK
ncbi:MAG: UDP-N-acetylglucosamine--N-acetylmuramyl-(pentapeptide) pyrophosphoryl-undecaprenol N-acetylglucosamine transferase [Candidatus Omnitrophota bacterium]